MSWTTNCEVRALNLALVEMLWVASTPYTDSEDSAVEKYRYSEERKDSKGKDDNCPSSNDARKI